MEIREWKEVTPELSELLQRLDDKSAANAFIEKRGRTCNGCLERVSF